MRGLFLVVRRPLGQQAWSGQGRLVRVEGQQVLVGGQLVRAGELAVRAGELAVLVGGRLVRAGEQLGVAFRSGEQEPEEQAEGRPWRLSVRTQWRLRWVCRP